MSAFAGTLEVIRDAITNHKQLTFTLNNRHRITCPHILGMKDGVWKVFVWQINNESEGGFKPGAQRWRCLDVNTLVGVSAQAGDWHRGWTEGKKPNTCIEKVDTVVTGSFAAEIR